MNFKIGFRHLVLLLEIISLKKNISNKYIKVIYFDCGERFEEWSSQLCTQLLKLLCIPMMIISLHVYLYLNRSLQDNNNNNKLETYIAHAS